MVFIDIKSQCIRSNCLEKIMKGFQGSTSLDETGEEVSEKAAGCPGKCSVLRAMPRGEPPKTGVANSSPVSNRRPGESGV